MEYFSHLYMYIIISKCYVMLQRKYFSDLIIILTEVIVKKINILAHLLIHLNFEADKV